MYSFIHTNDVQQHAQQHWYLRTFLGFTCPKNINDNFLKMILIYTKLFVFSDHFSWRYSVTWISLESGVGSILVLVVYSRKFCWLAAKLPLLTSVLNLGLVVCAMLAIKPFVHQAFLTYPKGRHFLWFLILSELFKCLNIFHFC